MLLHMLLAQVAMLFNTFWWRSYTACTAFLLGIFVMSAWNGGWWGVGSTDLAAGATVRIRLSEIAGSDLVPHSTLSLNPCPTPGANFYFEIFAHRYVSQVGLGPRAAKPTPSGSQEPSRQQQHPQRQDSGAATVSTASLRHKAE